MSKITVIIPVYNAPKAVDFLLKSLRENTSRSLVDQIIIGNDNSDATTTALIDQLIIDDQLFAHVKRNKNLGFLSNVNDLFKRAEGEIVVLLNSVLSSQKSGLRECWRPSTVTQTSVLPVL